MRKKNKNKNNAGIRNDLSEWDFYRFAQAKAIQQTEMKSKQSKAKKKEIFARAHTAKRFGRMQNEMLWKILFAENKLFSAH